MLWYAMVCDSMVLCTYGMIQACEGGGHCFWSSTTLFVKLGYRLILAQQCCSIDDNVLNNLEQLVLNEKEMTQT